MIKRLILLFLLFLSFSLMGTTAKAMDCEWVSKLKTTSGLETDVSDKDYLNWSLIDSSFHCAYPFDLL